MLTPGLSGTDISIASESLVVATQDGAVVAIDGEGAVTTVFPPSDVRRLTVNGAHQLGLIAGDGVRLHSPPWGSTFHRKAHLAVDLCATCGDGLWLIQDRGLSIFNLHNGQVLPFGPSQSDLLGVEFIDCDQALAWTRSQVLIITPSAVTALPHLESPVHSAVWNRGSAIYVAHGSPPQLTAVSLNGVRLRSARLPSAPVAMVFGSAGLLPPENLYLLEENAITYTRPTLHQR